MQGLNLLNEAKATVVSTGASAGETTVTTAALDMAGYDSVMFLICLGTQVSTAVITATAEQCTTSGGTYAPIVDALTGNNAAVTVTDAGGSTDNTVMVLDLFRPSAEFVELSIARTVANSQIDQVIALQYNAKKKPVVQDASVVAAGLFVGT